MRLRARTTAECENAGSASFFFRQLSEEFIDFSRASPCGETKKNYVIQYTFSKFCVCYLSESQRASNCAGSNSTQYHTLYIACLSASQYFPLKRGNLAEHAYPCIGSFCVEVPQIFVLPEPVLRDMPEGANAKLSSEEEHFGGRKFCVALIKQ